MYTSIPAIRAILIDQRMATPGERASPRVGPGALSGIHCGRRGDIQRLRRDFVRVGGRGSRRAGRHPARREPRPPNGGYRSLLPSVAWTSAGARTISDRLGAWKMMLAGPRLVGVLQISGSI